MTTRQQILDTLAKAPDGMTALQVTQATGCASYSAQTLLSKLAAYGKIEKIKPPKQSKCIWRIKPEHSVRPSRSATLSHCGSQK